MAHSKENGKLKLLISQIRFLSLALFFLISFSAEGKTVVVKSDKPLEDQFKFVNTTYVIKERIDLKGKQIALPEKSKLRFKGGQFCNGTLIGNTTKLKGKL